MPPIRPRRRTGCRSQIGERSHPHQRWRRVSLILSTGVVVEADTATTLPRVKAAMRRGRPAGHPRRPICMAMGPFRPRSTRSPTTAASSGCSTDTSPIHHPMPDHAGHRLLSRRTSSPTTPPPREAAHASLPRAQPPASQILHRNHRRPRRHHLIPDGPP